MGKSKSNKPEKVTLDAPLADWIEANRQATAGTTKEDVAPTQTEPALTKAHNKHNKPKQVTLGSPLAEWTTAYKRAEEGAPIETLVSTETTGLAPLTNLHSTEAPTNKPSLVSEHFKPKEVARELSNFLIYENNPPLPLSLASKLTKEQKQAYDKTFHERFGAPRREAVKIPAATPEPQAEVDNKAGTTPSVSAKTPHDKGGLSIPADAQRSNAPEIETVQLIKANNFKKTQEPSWWRSLLENIFPRFFSRKELIETQKLKADRDYANLGMHSLLLQEGNQPTKENPHWKPGAKYQAEEYKKTLREEFAATPVAPEVLTLISADDFKALPAGYLALKEMCGQLDQKLLFSSKSRAVRKELNGLLKEIKEKDLIGSASSEEGRKELDRIIDGRVGDITRSLSGLAKTTFDKLWDTTKEKAGKGNIHTAEETQGRVKVSKNSPSR